MFIIYGGDYYGRVLQVPGICYIESYFVHIFWLPYLPLQSYLRLDPSFDLTKYYSEEELSKLSYNLIAAVRVPWNPLSAFMGIFRAALLFISAMATFMAFMTIFVAKDPKHQEFAFAAIMISVSVAFLGLFAISRLLTRASRERAHQLVEKLGLPDDLLLR